MKKKLLTLALLPLLLVSGCKSNGLGGMQNKGKAENVATIPPYTPPTPPDMPKSITSIDVTGIPEDCRIGMGLFDELNICCVINYDDGTSYSFQLLQENLPYEVREMLGEPGEHNITIQMNNITKTFKVIMVDEGIRYVVRFLNYNDDVLYITKVMPNNKVQYTGDAPRRMSDLIYKYTFNDWDEDLDTYLVDHSVDIHAQFTPVFKCNDYLPTEQKLQYVSEYKGQTPEETFERNYVCYYVGRITHFPVARDTNTDYVNHTLGNKEFIDYDFDYRDSPIDPDPSSPKSGYHPNIIYTLPGVVSKVYKYEDPQGAIDSKYIPAIPQFINFASINDVPFEIHSVRSRNIEGKTYDTAVSDYVEVVNEFLDTDKTANIYVPEDFPTGRYTATVFMDLDIYAYVYAEDRGDLGISNSGIFEVACPAEIYVGLNSEEYEMQTFNYKTSTYDEDMMRVDIFAEMMKHARSVYEE